MMRRLNILIIFILLFITGCSKFHMDLGIARVNSLLMEYDDPTAPQIYKQGYKDGCESGYSGYANSTNKMFWTWKQDPVLAQNKVYYQIWKDAYSYCANYGMMADEHGLGNWR